jgi:peroxiredoxin Q/BCP
MSLEIGQQSPEFCLPDMNENSLCLSDLKEHWVVLYFYPRDNTSGCTLEAINFSGSIQKFQELNTRIIGISPDTVKSHCAFRDRHNLKVTLLSDEKHEVCVKYGIWVLKKNYGREYYGVERSTFIINPAGRIAAVWRKVRVPGHIEEVREKLIELQAV